MSNHLLFYNSNSPKGISSAINAVISTFALSSFIDLFVFRSQLCAVHSFIRCHHNNRHNLSPRRMFSVWIFAAACQNTLPTYCIPISFIRPFLFKTRFDKPLIWANAQNRWLPARPAPRSVFWFVVGIVFSSQPIAHIMYLRQAAANNHQSSSCRYLQPSFYQYAAADNAQSAQFAFSAFKITYKGSIPSQNSTYPASSLPPVAVVPALWAALKKRGGIGSFRNELSVSVMYQTADNGLNHAGCLLLSH